MRCSRAHILFGVVLFLATPTLANRSGPLTFSPLVCAEALAALARAHRQTLLGLEIAPFEDAHDRLHAHPVVTNSHPRSLESLRRDFENLLSSLGTAADPMTLLESFRTRWGFSEAQLVDVLLPYRITSGPHRHVLRTLFPNDAEAQELAAWARYRVYLEEAPRLAARYDYYLNHVGTKSVPEMARDLREGGDSAIDENRVRREIAALHLSITDTLSEPLTSNVRTELDALLAPHGTRLPAAVATREEAMEFAIGAGVARDSLAGALGLTEQQLRFTLHYSRLQPRAVPWTRVVRDATGSAWTEENFLRHLLEQEPRPTRVEIARMLNEAAGRERNRAMGPEDEAYRTVASVQAKLSALGETATNRRAPDRREIDGFGVVVNAGALQVPQALAFIRARRGAGKSYAEIAIELGVHESTVREHERRYSELFRDQLPSVLSRFLRPPHAGANRNAWRVDFPPPGEDASFDRFFAAFRAGTDGWAITMAVTQARELEAIRVALGIGVDTWNQLLSSIPRSAGGTARENEFRSGISANDANSIRFSRYRYFGLLRALIAHYNARPGVSTPLTEAMLESPEGLRAVIAALRGSPATTGSPYRAGPNPSFDRFSAAFRAGTEGWEIAKAKGQAREFETIREALGIEANAWNRLVGDFVGSHGRTARSNELGLSGVRANSILRARYRYFELLRELIARYNARPGVSAPLTEAMLESPAGLRAVIGALRGSPVDAGNPYDAGRNPSFDRFFSAFRTGTEGWEMTSAAGQARELEAIRVALGIEAGTWNVQVGNLAARAGAVARSNESRSSISASTANSIRYSRYRYFELLRQLIPHYNARPGVTTPLTEAMLESPEGLRTVIGALRGAPLTAR